MSSDIVWYMENIQGYVDKIIFRNEENGYTVFNLEENGCETVCTGSFAAINEGEYMELDGDFVLHPVYGEQFKVALYKASLPEDVFSIERYLASGAIKGIGKVTAQRIVEKFGEDTLRVIDEEPERLVEIKGISPRRAREIASNREEKKDVRRALIFLSGYGISNELAVSIYKQYGEAVYTIMEENPYKLADDVKGIGFKKADEIAFNAGIRPDSQFRIKACILYVLSEAEGEGNVYMPDGILKERVLSMLKPTTVDDISEITNDDIEQAIMALAIEMRIKVINTEEERQIYHSAYYYTEANIARLLNEINIKGETPDEKIEERIREIEKKENIILDELQREAVKAAVNTGLLIITGGPGTGKTTTINIIIKYFEDDFNEIILAAPTGRAAKRMTETTGFEAKTIHRLLELSSELEDTSGGADFERNEDNPLEADVVIIDETSMVDMFLMNALLKAVRPGTRLILVGDMDQLPSVGPGNVLKDIINSEKFKTIKLDRIFRQAEGSDIVVNAHKINRGEKIELRPDSKDFIFIKRENANVVLGSVLTLIKDKLPAYVGADLREIQVLTPVKKGTLGVENMNRFLQEMLNPASPEKRELPVGADIFREGDKVMHIKNNYSLEWEMKTKSGFVYESGKGVFNGDLGIIEQINENTQMVEVIFEDGKRVIYEFNQLSELTLAYVCTVHKSQGSEYPAVVLPLLNNTSFLMNKNVLYTAVTRAKKCVCVVGSDETVLSMIKNDREQKRFTGLKDRIEEFCI